MLMNIHVLSIIFAAKFADAMIFALRDRDFRTALSKNNNNSLKIYIAHSHRTTSSTLDVLCASPHDDVRSFCLWLDVLELVSSGRN